MTVFHVLTQDEFDRIVSGEVPRPDGFNPLIVAPNVKAMWLRDAFLPPEEVRSPESDGQ